MSLSNPSWDRPGDARHAPRPQSPDQLDVYGLAGEFGAHGLSLALPPANSQTWAKTTSGSKQTVTFAGGATTQAYPALTQLYSSQDGTWSDGVVCWLVGANGETLTNGNRYGPVTAAGFDGSGVAVYAEDVTAAASNTITVQGTDPGTGDSTVTLTGIATLDFNESSGLSVASISGTEAKVALQAASATHAGMVTTGTQTFTGAKTFDGFGPVTFKAATTSWIPASGVAVAFSFPLTGNVQFAFSSTVPLYVDSSGIHMDDSGTLGATYHHAGNSGATGSFSNGTSTIHFSGGIIYSVTTP